MKHALTIFAAAAAIHGSAAYASDAIVLPNGITVPYYGQAAPVFRQILNGRYIIASDPATRSSYFYSATGTWVGVQGADGYARTDLPTLPNIPANVTLPNGIVIPYRGIGIPEITTMAGGRTYSIYDPVAQRYSFRDEQGNPVGGGASSDHGVPLASSSSFGSTSLPSGGQNSSFGSSGITSSGPGGTSSAGSSVGGSGTIGGGSADVPAPGGFLLFGLSAAAIIAARRRSKKR